MRMLISMVIFITFSMTSFGQVPSKRELVSSYSERLPKGKPVMSVLNAWQLDYDNPIEGEWKMLDTIDFVDDIPHHYEVWNHETIFVKEVKSETHNSPMDQLFYQTKINLHTGEFWARTYRVTWKKIEQTEKAAFKGGAVLRKTNQ